VLRAATQPERYPLVFTDLRKAVVRRFPYSVFFRARGECLDCTVDRRFFGY
jgi:hypothetical protein